jgi:dipeptidyl aminopeptidase/acylaminoacyl peptidase
MKRRSRYPLSFFLTLLVGKSALLTTTLLLPCLSTISAQGTLDPNKNLDTIGVPPIPASLAREVEPYNNIYGLPLAGWNPAKREIWLKGLSSVTWISRVPKPGATPETSSIYIKSTGIYDIYFQPQGKYLVYTRDANGNETFQLYLYAIRPRKTKILSDGKSRNTEPVWSNSGDRIVYSSSPLGAEGVNLRLLNPFNPKSDRLLEKSSGGYLKAYDWSPDNRSVLYCDFSSNIASTLWSVDVATGKKDRLSAKTDTSELYDFPQFSKDGKRVYVITDHDSDFRRLAYIELTSRKIGYVPSVGQWDVEEFQLSPDGTTVAFTTNEDGLSKLHLFDLRAEKARDMPQLRDGIISDLKWNRGSTELAFNVKSWQSPDDVYSVNVHTEKVEQWAKSVTNGVDTSKFSKPDLIHWQTFDKRTLSGFLHRPAEKFKGKRPVIVDIHGGPEEQYRPGFLYHDNYLLNELGVAKIYPNVRGSSGYGKSFLNLDNGVLREGAVKDIGALLDWIKTQPDLDADRVLVQGVSYGGYLALSAAYVYGDRIRAVISDSGISNLASFVEHTEGWRRELQRSEFGDERDPKIREFMERTSPLNNAGMIIKPLLMIQGQNDPRVPVSEATKLLAATKNRIPVWYILGKNEGHGFLDQTNLDYRLYATILFVKEFLLK